MRGVAVSHRFPCHSEQSEESVLPFPAFGTNAICRRQIMRVAFDGGRTAECRPYGCGAGCGRAMAAPTFRVSYCRFPGSNHATCVCFRSDPLIATNTKIYFSGVKPFPFSPGLTDKSPKGSETRERGKRICGALQEAGGQAFRAGPAARWNCTGVCPAKIDGFTDGAVGIL